MRIINSGSIRPAGRAVIWREPLVETCKHRRDDGIDPAQQMTFRHAVLKPELVEQCALTCRLPSHYRRLPPMPQQRNQRSLRLATGFFNSIIQSLPPGVHFLLTWQCEATGVILQSQIMQVTVSTFPIGVGQQATAHAAKSTQQTEPRSAGGGPASVSDPSQLASSRAQVAIADIAAAGALMPPSSGATSYFAQFFPTRDGSPATALARSVVDPGAESSSAGKTAKEVALDARARMNAVYDSMAASGKAFDYNSFEGKDANSLLGDLDRRSLTAVSINSGGLFTKQEQDLAQSLMVQQQGLAMGLYSGPISLKGNFIDPFSGDHAERMKAGVKFLDRVSTDEKMTLTWAFARASAQISYEITVEEDGGVPENLASEDPTVQLIKAAMQTMKESMERNRTTGPIRTTDELKSQPWFKGFESQLDAANAKSQSMYEARLSHS
jgi:hypothetical protein